MKIPVPNPQMSGVRVEVINEKGEQYTVTAGGGLTVEVEDNIVEAILTSYTPRGESCQHAWSKGRGVETLDTFLENKMLREKVSEFERKQKQSARKPRTEKKDEEVPATSVIPREKTES